MPRQNERMPSWVRHSGMGIELAAAVARFVLAGVWVDRHYGTAPWGVVVGAVLGLLGGMYNLIRESLAAIRGQSTKDENEL
jgi:F0F1-type ATP synthase assembly protein I